MSDSRKRKHTDIKVQSKDGKGKQCIKTNVRKKKTAPSPVPSTDNDSNYSESNESCTSTSPSSSSDNECHKLPQVKSKDGKGKQRIKSSVKKKKTAPSPVPSTDSNDSNSSESNESCTSTSPSSSSDNESHTLPRASAKIRKPTLKKHQSGPAALQVVKIKRTSSNNKLNKASSLRTEVYFDLETTGLDPRSHITQLAAVYKKKGQTRTFSRYVIPKVLINKRASEITGLTVEDEQLCKNGKPVTAVTIRECIHEFQNFLEETGTENILVGHNINQFDFPVFSNAVQACGGEELLQSFGSTIWGFMDTLPLMKAALPFCSSYGQQNLVKSILKHEYDAHDALEDVTALLKLVQHVAPGQSMKFQHTISFDDATENFTRAQQAIGTLKRHQTM